MHYCYSLSISATGVIWVKCLAQEPYLGILVGGTEGMCNMSFFPGMQHFLLALGI